MIMKIFGPDEPGKIGLKPTLKKDEVKGGKDFARILAEENKVATGAKSENAGQSKQAEGPHFPSHIPLTSLDSEGEVKNREKAAALAEKVLDRLEFFKSALENPKVDISKFSSLIESLKNEGNSLEKVSAKISSGNPLKNLTEETATLAATEVIKFNRGDYG